MCFWIYSAVMFFIYLFFFEKKISPVVFFFIYIVIGVIIFAIISDFEKKKAEKEKELKVEEAEIERLKRERENLEKELEREKNLLDSKKQEISSKIQQEQKRLKDNLEAIKKIELEAIPSIPWVASMYADYKIAGDNSVSNYLRHKKRPAFKAADELKRIAQEKRDEIAKRKEAEYLVSYYESLYPALVELRSPCELEEALPAQEHESSFSVEGDDASYWLSKEEYNALPAVEKYQLALDRYWKRRKSKWEIGRDFERFIGYKYEQDNYDVYYKGIIDGLEDLGRDLVCKKKGSIHVVQCKYWSCSKEIHEKHINQLFGTTAMHYLQSMQKGKTFTDFTNSIKLGEIVPVFVTSTKLSDTAIEFAKTLGVVVRQGIKLETYPLIKCNVSKRTGEKIYHLPFDQQYDKIKIEGDAEFFAHTIKEAEEKGFRRAFKWRPE